MKGGQDYSQWLAEINAEIGDDDPVRPLFDASKIAAKDSSDYVLGKDAV